MRKIAPKVDVFNGINNALNPCSPIYRQGAAWDAQNSRLNKSGLWDKAAALSACSLGAAVVRGLPVSSTADHPHFADCNIKGVHIIAKNLKDDSHIVVGPNKYAYAVDNNLGGSSGHVHWWDGTDAPSSKTISAITVASNVVTATTTTAHGFHVSQIVDITGTTNFNTTDKTILSVPSTTTLTYAQTLDVDDEAAGAVAIANPAVTFTDNVTACNYAISGIGAPTTAIAVADNGDNKYGGRMEMGVYYYMYTLYDTAREVESLPSNVTSWTSDTWEYFAGAGGTNAYYSAIYPTVTITVDASHASRLNTTTKVRIYRSFRTSDAEKVFNPPNQFYYVGEISYNATAMTFTDYAHDTEIENSPYEGRGSRPPSAVDCIAPFNNRMYYFVGNIVYWSSSGRPEEVAQNYTLTYVLDNPNGGAAQTTTVPMQPLLINGISGEAKYEISELRGETIVGAYPEGNKLWIWTQNSTGYLKTSNQSEGVTYSLIRKGLGLVSSKTLAFTPYGLFGADREGIWQLSSTMVPRRLSKDIIDIDDSTKSTYALQSTLNESFGIWVAGLSEYWWCLVNTGESTVHRQIAFQPARSIFGGIYAYSGLTGGCDFVSTSGAKTFLTYSKTVDDSNYESLVQTLQFWMGQHSLANVKDDLKMEIIYESITASKSVSVTVYQNNIASTTGAQQSSTFTHDSNNLVGKVEPHGSGRMFMVSISVPADCQSPIVSINYSVNEIEWNEKARR